MAEFVYDAPDEVSADTLAGIVADMSGPGPRISDEEREQRQLEHWRFLEQQRVRLEQERYERNRARAEAGAAKDAQERQTAALERQERTRQLQERMRQDSDQRLRDAKLDSLHQANIRNEAFRRNLMRSQSLANQRQDLSDTLDAWWNVKYPPPPPEPTVVVVSEDDGSADFGSRNFDVAKWSKKPRSWF